LVVGILQNNFNYNIIYKIIHADYLHFVHTFLPYSLHPQLEVIFSTVHSYYRGLQS